MFRRVPRSVFVAPVAALAVVAVACVQEAIATESGEDAIRGGIVEKGYGAVGILRMQNSNFCTGTLVAPDIVLTAAHCLREKAVTFHLGSGKKVKDYRSTAAIDTMTKTAVAEQVAYPGFGDPRAAGCPSTSIDVALVKLAEPVTDVEPNRIDFRSPTDGESCTTVGFGNHEGWFHEKRSATQKMRQLRDTAYGFEAFRTSTEGGDSGGPLFCGETIVAVNSCGNAPDWFARLDRAKPWLDAMLGDWDPAAAAKLVEKR